MITLFQGFRRWLFSTETPHLAALMRIAFGTLYLVILWDFYPVMDILFGHGGLFGTMSDGYVNLRNPFHALYALKTGTQLEVWFWASVFFGVLTVVGLFSRLSLALSFFSLLLFQLRDPWMLYGADKVMRMCGLWLLFANTNQIWSVDSWWKQRQGQIPLANIEGWPLHAMQIQVAMIYAYAGLNKLSRELWLDGSALYYSLQVEGCNHAFFPWLLQYKTLLAYLTYGALAIELAFPVLVFVKSTRKLALFAIVALHVGIDLFMHIRLFSTAMYFAFFIFTEPATWNLRALAVLPRVHSEMRRIIATRLRNFRKTVFN